MRKIANIVIEESNVATCDVSESFVLFHLFTFLFSVLHPDSVVLFVRNFILKRYFKKVPSEEKKQANKVAYEARAQNTLRASKKKYSLLSEEIKGARREVCS